MSSDSVLRRSREAAARVREQTRDLAHPRVGGWTDSPPDGRLGQLLTHARRGKSGETIARHRALSRFHFPLRRLASIVLIPIGLDLLMFRLQPLFAALSAQLFAFGLPRPGLAGDVTLAPMAAGPAHWRVPVASLATHAPTAFEWSLTLAVVVLVLQFTRALPDRALPIAYVLRFAAFIQTVALLYFAMMPAAFPYDLPTHLARSFETGTWFMLAVPWVLGLTYNVFDFAFWRKLALALLCTVFLAAALPLQLLCHAYLVSVGSLLVLPLLYLVFGVLPLTLGCIGLYGYAMSWPRRRLAESAA